VCGGVHFYLWPFGVCVFVCGWVGGVGGVSTSTLLAVFAIKGSNYNKKSDGTVHPFLAGKS